MFEWTVDILMGTKCVSFTADYSFVSMKRTILTLVVEAILAIFLSCEMSLKSFFCAYRIDHKDNIIECVVQIKAFGCCSFNL